MAVGSRPLAVPASSKHAVGDFAGTAEALGVGESVAAPESADGLALASDKRQRRVRTDGVAELLEFPVDGSLAQRRLKAVGSRKMSMSSENRWIRFQPLARLVPPLKITLSPALAAMIRRASVT